MTLDATKPTDQALVSELPGYIRTLAAAINALSISGTVGASSVEVSAGATSLTIGTELSDASIEVVVLSGAGPATLSTITDGTQGQIKIFIFQDANVKFEDGNAKNSGKFYLNQLPISGDFEPAQDDVLVIVNIAGDGGSTYGYWKELYRTLSVK